MTNRPVYAPHGYVCPYQHACPHLHQQSTTWVYGQYERAGQKEQEMRGQIDRLSASLRKLQTEYRQLKQEHAELKAKYAVRHRQQFKVNRPRNAAKENPSAGEQGAPKKKRGAKPGHEGWSRKKPAKFDAVVEVPAPEQCPHCQCDALRPHGETHEHWQQDIVLTIKPVSTKYVHQQSYCPGCRKYVMQQAQGETIGSPIGPVAKSTALYLHHDIGVSYRKIQRLFKDLFGFEFSHSALVGFNKTATRKGMGLYEDLREKIRVASYIHADETHWRQDGVNHYLWFAGNRELAYYQIDRHRSGEVAKSILGEGFEGALITDGYQAYNAVMPATRQSCLAHLLRHVKEITAELNHLEEKERDHKAVTFCRRANKFLKKACQLNEDPKLKAMNEEQVKALEKRLQKKLDNLCRYKLTYPRAETFRKRLIGKERNQWFTFLYHEDVGPTNNLAEQAIRPMVIFRKTSFGTRSEAGSVQHSVMASLIQTAKRQGNHPREFLNILLADDTSAAEKTLYKGS